MAGYAVVGDEHTCMRSMSTLIAKNVSVESTERESVNKWSQHGTNQWLRAGRSGTDGASASLT
jgi:hypothetical protein